MNEETEKTEYFNKHNPLQVEKKEKKRLNGYNIEIIVIVILAIIFAVVKFVFN